MISKDAITRFLKQERDSYTWLKREPAQAIDAALNELSPPPNFGGTKLWLHQKVCFLLLQEIKRFMLFLDLGAGKTFISLQLIRYRKQCGEKPRAIVFVPYITSVATWIDEAALRAPDLKCVPLLGSSKENLASLGQEADLFIACYQSAVAMVTTKQGKKWKLRAADVRRHFAGFDMLILDEVHRCLPTGVLVQTPTEAVPIESIKVGDLVETGLGPRPVIRTFKNQASKLVKICLADGKFIKCTPNHPFLTDNGWKNADQLEGEYTYRQVEKVQTSGKMPSLREQILGYDVRSKPWAQILQRFMRKKTYKPNVGKRSSCESFSDPQKERKWPGEKPWREWKRTDKATSNVARGTWAWVASGITNILRQTKAAWISNVLQSRHRESPIEDGDRMRWVESYSTQEEEVRLKARHQAGRVRVVSVSFEKRTDPVDVFNIEVSGYQHYFADGILVHNCQSATSLVYRMCRAISSQCEYVLGLTGTPFGNNLEALWPQFYLIDFGETLGNTLGFYKEVFFNKKPNFWGGFEYTFKKRSMPDLKRIIRHKSIRYMVDEFYDMPPKELITKKISKPEQGAGFIEKAMEAIRKEAAGGKSYHVIRSNYLQLRQLSSGFLTLHGEDTQKLQIKFDDNPKLDALMELIEGMPEGHKMVVFHEFVYSNFMIAERLRAAKIGHARIWSGQRDKLGELRRFRDGPACTVMVINSKSGSSSLNLQFASYIVFFEQPVSSIDRIQAEGRCWRPGQPRRVFIYDLLVTGTLDTHMKKANRDGQEQLEYILNHA